MSSLSQNSLGKYQLLALLGQGGMGEVYKAHDPTLNRNVAIKTLSVATQARDDFILRFQKEAEALARLHHPHIVQVYHFDSNNGLFYLVMEFIEGPTLQQKLDPPGQPFTLAEANSIFNQLAGAVGCAHEQGIIHRDLKPANVLFRTSGQVVLTDFGLARLSDQTSHTQAGQLLGTYKYMAPELYQGAPAGVRSDIYSLGIILYEMLCGRPPFTAADLHILLYDHLHNQPPSPRLYNPGLPGAVEQVVLKALAKAPDERWQTAVGMACALAEAIQARPHFTPLPEKAPAASVQRAKLAQLLDQYFSQAELKTLCFNLGVDYDNVLGEAKENKAQELAAYLDRRGRLPELREEIARQRPHISWPDEQLVEPQDEQPATPQKVSITLYKHREDIIGRPSELFGRKDLLRTIKPLLRGKKHLLLHGLGGAGKTALAATVAESWLQGGQERRVIWAQSGDGDAETILDALVEELGQDRHEKQAIRQATGGPKRLKMVNDLLARCQPVLLVIDDVWHENALTLLKAMGRTAVIVTSRRRFSGFDKILEVGDLTPDAALQFLAAAARDPDLNRDPDALRLCKLLSYHAYLLELAGRRIEIDRVDGCTPGRLLADIKKERPHRSLMPPGKDYDERRKNFAVLMENSFTSLPKAEQELFLAFGDLFTSRATVELLRQFILDPTVDIQSALITLSRYSLVRRYPAEKECYALHDLTYYYIKEKSRLIKGENLAARLEIIHQYVKKHIHDFDCLGLDIGNILGAAEEAGIDLRIQLMEALTVKGYLDEKGHTFEYLRLLDSVIKHLQQRNNQRELDSDQVKLLRNFLGKRGNTYFDRGDYHNATAAYEACLNLTDEEPIRARLFGLLGKTLSFENKTEKAKNSFEQAYKIADELNDDALRGFLLSQEAHTAGFAQDFEAAHRIATKQVEINERLWQEHQDEPTLRELFNSLINLGGAELDLAKQISNQDDQIAGQRIKRALSIHRRARGYARKLNDTGRRATAAWALAEDYHLKGKRGRVRDLLQRARSMWHSIGVTRHDKIIDRFLKEHGYKPINK
jgi:serine/threonine protein kinase